MNRTSPSPGPAVEYLYEAELKNCGQLATYELVFDTNSDQLRGTDWPILQVLSDLLKKDKALRIEIAGHTDNTETPRPTAQCQHRKAKAL